MDIKDGDVITVRPRDGGPAPSMVGLSTRRSASRTSMSKMGSFAKKGSFVKLNSASQGALVRWTLSAGGGLLMRAKACQWAAAAKLLRHTGQVRAVLRHRPGLQQVLHRPAACSVLRTARWLTGRPAQGGGDELADDMNDATLDERDPMFNDAFSPRDKLSRTSFTGMPRAVSKGDVLAQEHSQARQDNPHSMPDSADSAPPPQKQLLHACLQPCPLPGTPG